MSKRIILGVLLLVIAVGGPLWLTSRAVTPQEAEWDDVLAQAERGGYQVVSTDELRELYQREPDLLLVDTRQEWEFAAGHMEGAVVFPMEPTWWARWSKKDDLRTLLGEDKERTIVFYWDGLAWVRSDSAARVAVSLGYVNVYRDPLGFREWEEKGHPTAAFHAEFEDGHVQAPFALEAPGPLHGWAMVWTLLGIFLGGMALNLTPCVYPLIPITVSYFAGRDEQGKAGLIAHGLLYIGGLALTNSILGTLAAMTGGLMGGLLQNPLVLSGIALVLLAFAMSLFGFWELRMPAALARAASKSRAGYVGTLFMGLTLGVVAAPCIGPFVLGLLTWVATMGSPWIGFLVFFTLSLGLGIPLFVLAVFSGNLQRLPRSGEWMIWVRKLMGWVLVGMAAYFVRPVLGEPWGLFLMAGAALAAAVHLAWVDRSTATPASGFRAFPWIKNGVGVAGLLLAVLLVGSWAARGAGVDWQPYSDRLLEQAREQSRPVIIDFYATWCAPCRELEAVTFHHPEVVERARDMVMIKIDVTRGGNPLHERLLRDYRVRGVPTIVFLDARGRERVDLRLVDFLAPEAFAVRMDQLLNIEQEE